MESKETKDMRNEAPAGTSQEDKLAATQENGKTEQHMTRRRSRIFENKVEKKKRKSEEEEEVEVVEVKIRKFDEKAAKLMNDANAQKKMVPVKIKKPIKNELYTKKITKETELKPTSHTIGFIGVGTIAKYLMDILVNMNQKIYLWYDNRELLKSYKGDNIQIAGTLKELVDECDIIMWYTVNEIVSKELFYKNFTFRKMLKGKILVDLTSSCPETALVMHDTVADEGGCFLEARIQGSVEEAREGSLTIFTSGDNDAFKASATYLQAFSKIVNHMGPSPGLASQMSLLVSSMKAGNISIMSHSQSGANEHDCAREYVDKFRQYQAVTNFAVKLNYDEAHYPDNLLYLKNLRNDMEYFLFRDTLSEWEKNLSINLSLYKNLREVVLKKSVVRG